MVIDFVDIDLLSLRFEICVKCLYFNIQVYRVENEFIELILLGQIG